MSSPRRRGCNDRHPPLGNRPSVPDILHAAGATGAVCKICLSKGDTMNNAIVGISYTTSIQFGSRDEIKELADRLVKMMPGGQNYTPSEALTLAQIAVAHDLDPFNGEVWLIKNEETGKVYGALIGLKGHRKHAKKQADYWG